MTASRKRGLGSTGDSGWTGPVASFAPWSRRLYVIIAALLVTSLLLRLAQESPGLDFRGLGSLQLWFDVDEETNVPTWFSCTLLFLCAQTMWLVAEPRVGGPRRWRLHERGLAAVFLYLSIDELTQIHEQVIKPLRSFLHLSGALYFAWTVVALPLTGLYALLMLGYLRALPRVTRRSFLLAGIMYVGGAAGVEMIGSSLYSKGKGDTVAYVLETVIEEGLEMTALVVFLTAARALLVSRGGLICPQGQCQRDA